MLFEKQPPINILYCEACKSTGKAGFGDCHVCRGQSAGHFKRGRWLYFSYPLTRYHLALERGRRILNKVRWLTFFVLGLNFLIWAVYSVYKSGLLAGQTVTIGILVNFYQNLSPSTVYLFWSGILCFTYVFYRTIRDKEFKGVVEHYDYKLAEHPEPDREFSKWQETRQIPRRKKHNIADAFTEEALTALGGGYHLADKSNHNAFLPIHLFYILLSTNRISNIFLRLGILSKSVEERTRPLFENKAVVKVNDSGSMPLPGPDLWQVIFKSYNKAYEAHQDFVSVTELFLSVVEESPELQGMLFDLGVEKNKLVNAVEWARIRERQYRQYLKFRRAAGHRSKSGMDKAMTALATPYLNQFSDDLTLLSQLGYLDACVSREKEVEEIFRAIDGGAKNVLLSGGHGVGKLSVVEGLAGQIIEDDVPKSLSDKRLVRLKIPALLAGATPSEAVERLLAITHEINRAGNIILFIHNIHEIAGVATGGGKGAMDMADALADQLKSANFITIATTTDEDFAKEVANTALGTVFTRVEIKEMNEDQAIRVLEAKVGQAEYKNNVFFSYNAIEKAVKMAGRFLRDKTLPGSALEVMTEAASYAHNKKGASTLVTEEDVAHIIADKTGIPTTAVTEGESEKLLHLEDAMHGRVIGQNEAVDAVANALRRARADVRSNKRPIANFLFLGPTGVGKTELAKTIAEVYFGGEDRTIRLDMSEYQEKSGIYRLIGAPGEKGTGILTEAVHARPFSLVLLDEIEKADKDILNLFLQVMDDGRLTDSVGRVVDFTNTIIIATSNAGTSFVQEQLRAGENQDKIKERLLHGELKQYFRPEFLNRFDGIVLFKALTREDIKKVAALMLKRVAKDLENKGLEMQVEDSMLEFLASVGFDMEFGARPMRRAIQEKVENKLAELSLSGKLKRGNKIILGEGGDVQVHSQ